jgi:hypothetical protein
MGFKCVVIALAFVACLCMTAFAMGPKNEYVEPEFPGEDMSGSQIYQEVREGVYDDLKDSALSFRNESLFTIRKFARASMRTRKMRLCLFKTRAYLL